MATFRSRFPALAALFIFGTVLVPLSHATPLPPLIICDASTADCRPVGSTDAPYDLTRFEADMVLAFDNNGIARPEWPRPPVYDNSPCNVQAGDEGSLRSCLSQAGKRIIVPAGEYTGPFIFDRSDQWIDMHNDAVLTGGVTMGGNAVRVKVTGGNFIAGNVMNAGIHDLLIENVNMYLKNSSGDRLSFLTCATGATCERMAIVNTTCHATISCLSSPQSPNGAITSLIVANFDAWSEFIPSQDQGNDEYVSRLQSTDRVMVVDSHFRVYPTSKPPQRFHYGSTATLLANNTFEGSGAGFTNFWIDTTAGGSELFDIDNMFILRNNFYQHDSSKISDINIDDSIAGNGIDVVLVHIEDNVSRHANTANFTIGGTWSASQQNCGNRSPCLRNINNRGEIVSNLSLVPFTGGADH